jgi:poly-gamma-glutamate synthesis protein (capsule biosynthesis protein)
MRKYLFCLWLVLTSVATGQGLQTDTSFLRLLFAGDIMNHQGQTEAAFDPATGTYAYDSCFAYIRYELAQADVCIANLEVTFGGKPYTGYPQFSAPDELGTALKNAGVDCFVTANNHCYDRGGRGFRRTLAFLDSLGFEHTGTFTDSASRAKNHPLFLERNGIRVALLNYTYGTNGIESIPPNIVNIIERDLIAADLQKAREGKPDKIIACMHWGVEYETEPGLAEVELAEWMLREGADVIIGSHPHVLQPMERQQGIDSAKTEIVVYSLGNFISNMRIARTDGGALFGLTLKKYGERCDIINEGYCLTWVYVPVSSGKKRYFVLPVSKFEDDSDFFEKGSYDAMMRFARESRELFDKGNRNIREYIHDHVTNTWMLRKD